MDYKHSVDMAIEDEKQGRTIKRKPDDPKANKRNFDQEDKDFGANEVELVLQRIAGEPVYTKEQMDNRLNFTEGKVNRGLIKYAGEKGKTKQAKIDKYLTVQALLDHPYFLKINTADISSVIDQYEELLNGNGFSPSRQ